MKPKTPSYLHELFTNLNEDIYAHEHSTEEWRQERLPALMSSPRTIFYYILPGDHALIAAQKAFGSGENQLDLEKCHAVQSEIVASLDKKYSDDISAAITSFSHLLRTSITENLEDLLAFEELSAMRESIIAERDSAVNFAVSATETADGLPDYAAFADHGIALVRNIFFHYITQRTTEIMPLHEALPLVQVGISIQAFLEKIRREPFFQTIRSLYDDLIRLRYYLCHEINEEVLLALGYVGNSWLISDNKSSKLVSIFNRRTELLRDIFLSFPMEIRESFPIYKMPETVGERNMLANCQVKCNTVLK